MIRKLTSLWVFRRLGIDHASRIRRRILGKGVLLTLVMLLLVVAQLFVSSMVKGIIDKYALLSNGHVQLFTFSLPSDDLLQAIEGDAGVAEVHRVVQGNALAYSSTGTQMIRLKGVSSDYFTHERLSQLHVLSDGTQKGSRQGMLVSSAMAEMLQVSLGDPLALMVVPDTATTVVRPILVTVAGIFDSGYRELDQQLCFIDQEYALNLFGAASSQYVEILVNQLHADDLTGVEDRLDELVKQPHIFRTWYEAQPTLYANLQVSQQMILGVFIVVSMLAGFFVASIAQEFMQDDKQSIATMKLLGAMDGTIRRIYFAIVLCLTCASMCLGLSLGLLVGVNMGPLLSLLADRRLPVLSWYLLDFTVIIPWKELLIIIAALILVSMCSVQFSLRRINKISPMELLR